MTVALVAHAMKLKHHRPQYLRGQTLSAAYDAADDTADDTADEPRSTHRQLPCAMARVNRYVLVCVARTVSSVRMTSAANCVDKHKQRWISLAACVCPKSVPVCARLTAQQETPAG